MNLNYYDEERKYPVSMKKKQKIFVFLASTLYR